MKKLFLVITILFLFGCSTEETEVVKETKTCKTQSQGNQIEMLMNAENDVIQTINISYLMPEKNIGINASELSEEEIENAGDSILTQLGVKESDEGIQVEVSAKKKDLLIEISFDLSKADTSVLEVFGVSGNPENVKLSDTIQHAQQSQTLSFTCQ